jgi:GNAT superfamily N-acetyltransferase
MNLPAGYALRPRTEDDLGFLRELYAATREEELRPVAWSARQKREFLDQQFAAQHTHYLQHYPQALWWVVTCDGQPVGRMYVCRTARDLRIMEVSLLEAHRNRGVGSALMRGLIEQAERDAIACSLHVEPFNPALRMYARLGFVRVAVRGVYWFMERRASVEDGFVPRLAGVASDRHQEDVETPVHGMQ